MCYLEWRSGQGQYNYHVVHCHDWDSHCLKFDRYRFTAFWDTAGNGTLIMSYSFSRFCSSSDNQKKGLSLSMNKSHWVSIICLVCVFISPLHVLLITLSLTKLPKNCESCMGPVLKCKRLKHSELCLLELDNKASKIIWSLCRIHLINYGRRTPHANFRYNKKKSLDF